MTGRQEYFADACRGAVEIRRVAGYCHVNISTGQLEEHYPYQWDASLYKSMALLVPVGYSPTLEIFELAEAPHFLVAGVTGYGKSNYLLGLIHALLPVARVAIIDLKRLQFSYLKNHCAGQDRTGGTVFITGHGQGNGKAVGYPGGGRGGKDTGLQGGNALYRPSH